MADANQLPWINAKKKSPFRLKRIKHLLEAIGALVTILGTLAGFRYYRASQPEADTLSRLSELGAKLRAIYHDCQAGERETAEVTRLLESDPGLAGVYPEFQRTRLSHVLEACRRVRSGQLLAAQRQFDRARNDFLKATEEDPENANAWAALGGACMLSDREEEARQAYERALTIDPDSWTAHYNYGCYFARKGESESALGHLERAVTLLDRTGNVDRASVRDDLRQNPALATLRQDPRFTRLLY
jgi:Flp pilus assembly protein TadD